MAKVAVVYHSGFGHTARVAEAVANGARSVQGTEVALLNVDEVQANWEKLDQADAIIFGAPTYMAGVSAQFKAFIDAAGGRWFSQTWKNKLAAGFTNSGSLSGDKFNTLAQLWANAMQHGMVWVSLGLLPPHVTGTNQSSRNDLNRVGSFGGVMTQSNNESSTEHPSEGDLLTGEHLGKRVATFATNWAAEAKVA